MGVGTRLRAKRFVPSLPCQQSLSNSDSIASSLPLLKDQHRRGVCEWSVWDVYGECVWGECGKCGECVGSVSGVCRECVGSVWGV